MATLAFVIEQWIGVSRGCEVASLNEFKKKNTQRDFQVHCKNLKHSTYGFVTWTLFIGSRVLDRKPRYSRELHRKRVIRQQSAWWLEPHTRNDYWNFAITWNHYKISFYDVSSLYL